MPAGTHVSDTALSASLQLADIAGLRQALKQNKHLKSLDASVSATFGEVADGNNIHWFVTKYLVMK